MAFWRVSYWWCLAPVREQFPDSSVNRMYEPVMKPFRQPIVREYDKVGTRNQPAAGNLLIAAGGTWGETDALEPGCQAQREFMREGGRLL
jgi:hypothetical protein